MGTRRASVSREKLVEAFFKVHEAGGSNEDLAAELGMDNGCLSARLSALRKDLKESKGVELPKLARSGSNGTKDAFLDSLAKQVQDNLSKLEGKSDESEDESEESDKE